MSRPIKRVPEQVQHSSPVSGHSICGAGDGSFSCFGMFTESSALYVRVVRCSTANECVGRMGWYATVSRLGSFMGMRSPRSNSSWSVSLCFMSPFVVPSLP